MKSTNIPSVVLPFLLATTTLSTTEVLKVFIPAAFGATLEAANTGAEVKIVQFLSSNEQTEDSVLFIAHRL